MKKEKLTERSVQFLGYAPEKISSEMPLFYNPRMIINRDISILYLLCSNEKMQICDLLAGTGIRTMRMIKEVGGKIKKIDANDGAPDFMRDIKKSFALNKIPLKKIGIHNCEASKFLLSSTGYDYIEIDPFGSPNPYLDASVRRLSRQGTLAVTATDTSALCGTHPKACRRKYWAEPSHTTHMHEIGLRILIRKVQLIGAQYDRALVPVVSYSDLHYMRVYFRSDKTKTAVDEVVKEHGMWNGAGPMWLGKLWDGPLLEKMIKKCPMEWEDTRRLLGMLYEEAQVNRLGFFDIHDLARKYKIGNLPKMVDVQKRLVDGGYKTSRTHFCDTAFRTEATEEIVLNAMR